MSYIVYSEYFNDFDEAANYDEAMSFAENFLNRQGEDSGLEGDVDVEIFKRVATVSGKMSINITVTEEKDISNAKSK